MAFPNIRRSDFSHSLVHLTKERREYVQDDKTLEQKLERVVPGFEVLKEILSDGVIRSSLGFLKGTRPVVCLSEIPLRPPRRRRMTLQWA